jgi:hypothetical protein
MFSAVPKTSSATSARNSNPPRPKLPSPRACLVDLLAEDFTSEPQNRQITFSLITDIGNSKQPGSWLMSWVIPRLLNSFLLKKTRKCAETDKSKGRNLGHHMLRRIQGGPCLNLLAAGQAGDETKMVKPCESLIGDASAAATLGDPQDLRASLPRAHVLFPSKRSHLDLCEPKKRRVPESATPNQCLKRLFFHRLIRDFECAGKGKS